MRTNDTDASKHRFYEISIRSAETPEAFPESFGMSGSSLADSPQSKRSSRHKLCVQRKRAFMQWPCAALPDFEDNCKY